MTYEVFYQRLVALFEEYNRSLVEQEHPYAINFSIRREYRSSFGDDRLCQCGHTYHRHFDTYEEMEPIGCKYCSCYTFVEEE